MIAIAMVYSTEAILLPVFLCIFVQVTWSQSPYVIFGGTTPVIRTRIDPIVNPGTVSHGQNLFPCKAKHSYLSSSMVVIYTMYSEGAGSPLTTITINKSRASARH